MTDKIKALDDLIAKVEAGDKNYYPGNCFHLATGGKPYEYMGKTRGALEVDRAYHGSLDAAKALHEALLPGWDWLVRTNDFARVTSPDYDQVTWEAGDRVVTDIVSGNAFEAYCENDPARAWLIAILKAYRAELSK